MRPSFGQVRAAPRPTADAEHPQFGDKFMLAEMMWIQYHSEHEQALHCWACYTAHIIKVSMKAFPIHMAPTYSLKHLGSEHIMMHGRS